MNIGEGKGNFLEKVSLPLPKPHPFPSKTFLFIESLMAISGEVGNTSLCL